MHYPSAILLVFCTASNYSDRWHFPASFAHHPGSPPACPLAPIVLAKVQANCIRKLFTVLLFFRIPHSHGEFGGRFKCHEGTGGTSEMDVTHRAAAGSSLSVGILPIYGPVWPRGWVEV